MCTVGIPLPRYEDACNGRPQACYCRMSKSDMLAKTWRPVFRSVTIEPYIGGVGRPRRREVTALARYSQGLDISLEHFVQLKIIQCVYSILSVQKCDTCTFMEQCSFYIQKHFSRTDLRPKVCHSGLRTQRSCALSSLDSTAVPFQDTTRGSISLGGGITTALGALATSFCWDEYQRVM